MSKLKPETLLFREVLHESRMTAKEFGERVGENQPSISRWNTGKYAPPLSKIVTMAEQVNLKITFSVKPLKEE